MENFFLRISSMCSLGVAIFGTVDGRSQSHSPLFSYREIKQSHRESKQGEQINESQQRVKSEGGTLITPFPCCEGIWCLCIRATIIFRNG
ncbi:hypothetical protein C1H46_032322 [Malus baccata]|uniref:Uncharacterized protein n=1 Tax=Malus baccata TaxID=106549 RepID=A0A540L6N5_MALBA|nr:hypothetical protein C1H46_032322 [Malus baccata]